MKFDYRVMRDDPDRQIHSFTAAQKLLLSEYHEVKDWCVEQFGPRILIRGARWYSNAPFSRFYFREANDAFAFKMRWG